MREKLLELAKALDEEAKVLRKEEERDPFDHIQHQASDTMSLLAEMIREVLDE